MKWWLWKGNKDKLEERTSNNQKKKKWEPPGTEMIKFHIGTLVSPVQSKKKLLMVLTSRRKKTKQKETNTNLSQ